MAVFFQYTAALFVTLIVRGSFELRIIGGEEVTPYSLKYQVSIQYGGRHYCGGTLVHPQWVATAAHCWKPSYLIQVVLSEHNLYEDEGFEQVLNVSDIFTYNYYNPRTFNGDIMLLKLSSPAHLNAYVQPAALPQPYSTVPTGTTCTVSGWGVTHVYSYTLSPVLRSVDIEVINPAVCNYQYYGKVTANMMCAGTYTGGKDSCQGDSGGPLVCKGVLEGIVSWGISCANAMFPGVYTKVANFVSWIEWIIKNNSN